MHEKNALRRALLTRGVVCILIRLPCNIVKPLLLKVRSDDLARLRRGVTCAEEIDELEVPDRMRTYLRKFYPDNL